MEASSLPEEPNKPAIRQTFDKWQFDGQKFIKKMPNTLKKLYKITKNASGGESLKEPIEVKESLMPEQATALFDVVFEIAEKKHPNYNPSTPIELREDDVNQYFNDNPSNRYDMLITQEDVLRAIKDKEIIEILNSEFEKRYRKNYSAKIKAKFHHLKDLLIREKNDERFICFRNEDQNEKSTNLVSENTEVMIDYENPNRSYKFRKTLKHTMKALSPRQKNVAVYLLRIIQHKYYPRIPLLRDISLNKRDVLNYFKTNEMVRDGFFISIDELVQIAEEGTVLKHLGFNFNTMRDLDGKKIVFKPAPKKEEDISQIIQTEEDIDRINKLTEFYEEENQENYNFRCIEKENNNVDKEFSKLVDIESQRSQASIK